MSKELELWWKCIYPCNNYASIIAQHNCTRVLKCLYCKVVCLSKATIQKLALTYVGLYHNKVLRNHTEDLYQYQQTTRAEYISRKEAFYCMLGAIKAFTIIFSSRKMINCCKSWGADICMRPNSFVNWLTRLLADLVPPVAAESPLCCHTKGALQRPSPAVSILNSSLHTKSGEPWFRDASVVNVNSICAADCATRSYEIREATIYIAAAIECLFRAFPSRVA